MIFIIEMKIESHKDKTTGKLENVYVVTTKEKTDKHNEFIREDFKNKNILTAKYVMKRMLQSINKNLFECVHNYNDIYYEFKPKQDSFKQICNTINI